MNKTRTTLEARYTVKALGTVEFTKGGFKTVAEARRYADSKPAYCHGYKVLETVEEVPL